MTLICILLFRTIADAPTVKKLRDYKSPESLEEKEPTGRLPDILEDKDQVEK